MKKIALLFAVAALIMACGNTGHRDSTYPEASVSEDMALTSEAARMSHQTVKTLNRAAAPQTPLDVETVEKKIIKDGRMGIKVKEVGKGKEAVDLLVSKYDAYYASEAYNDYSSSLVFDLTIRIPSKDYENFIADIEAGDAEVSYKNIDARDVTEEFYDLETRLANKRSYLARYRELLKKANSIKEILEVETYIRSLEEEIESAEGRLRLLGNQVDYSTLSLNLSQEKEIKPSPRDDFGHRMKIALSAGWAGFVSFVVMLFYVWPLWVIVAIVVFLVFYTIRKQNRRRRKAGNGK